MNKDLTVQAIAWQSLWTVMSGKMSFKDHNIVKTGENMLKISFFQPHIKQAKVPHDVWILVRPFFFLENVQTLAGKVPHKVWI